MQVIIVNFITHKGKVYLLAANSHYIDFLLYLLVFLEKLQDKRKISNKLQHFYQSDDFHVRCDMKCYLRYEHVYKEARYFVYFGDICYIYMYKGPIYDGISNFLITMFVWKHHLIPEFFFKLLLDFLKNKIVCCSCVFLWIHVIGICFWKILIDQ